VPRLPGDKDEGHRGVLDACGGDCKEAKEHWEDERVHLGGCISKASHGHPGMPYRWC